MNGGVMLSNNKRAEIQYLTSLGCTAGQIRLHLGLIVPGQTLCNARTYQPRQYRKDQGIQLEAHIQTDEDFHAHLVRDDNHFAGARFSMVYS
jgi:hypothetical protein